MSSPKVIFMPHGNIQYSQLDPTKRKWVMENSYRKIFDLVEKNGYRIAFEASGYTVEEIAKQAPDIMEQLKRLIQGGQIEPVSSPYIHVMVANIPQEVCLDSLKHALDIWEKYTGVRPETGWNPECSWASYIPELYKEAGFTSLVMDADSFLLSFEDIRKATGLSYDVQGHSNKNHLFKIEDYIADKPEYLKYITNPSVADNGLKMIFRSDCMANPMLWYLMGATEGLRDEPVQIEEVQDIFRKWKDRIAASGSFIMPYAEDAEYIGTSAYFYVKQFNQARFFEPEPESVSRFDQLIKCAVEQGYELSTPKDVLSNETVIENPHTVNIENGVAWHGGTAKAWANTEYSRIMDPVCSMVLEGMKAVAKKTGQQMDNLQGDLNVAIKALASAYVSDSRWPPAPTSPGRFNVRETLDDLYKANTAIASAMEAAGIAQQKSLYSPDIMKTQINMIDKNLMAQKYFGE